MNFRFELEPSKDLQGSFGVGILLDDYKIFVGVMSALSIFTDLEANQMLLRDKSIKSFLIYDEPLFGIEFVEDKIILFKYVEQNSFAVRKSWTYEYFNFYSYLRGFVEGLTPLIELLGHNPKEIGNLIQREINLGLYKIYQQ